MAAFSVGSIGLVLKEPKLRTALLGSALILAFHEFVFHLTFAYWFFPDLWLIVWTIALIPIVFLLSKTVPMGLIIIFMSIGMMLMTPFFGLPYTQLGIYPILSWVGFAGAGFGLL